MLGRYYIFVSSSKSMMCITTFKWLKHFTGRLLSDLVADQPYHFC